MPMFIKAEARIRESGARMKAFSSGFWILDSGSCFYIARKQATLAIACFLPQLVSPVKGGQARLRSIDADRPFSNIYFEGRRDFLFLKRPRIL
jgi:hypothetical protein